MSTCRDIRPLLLEAEPEALAGEGDGMVAAHLRSCDACAAAAQVILQETATLDRFLGDAPPAPSVDAILDAALNAGDAKDPAHASVAKVLPFPSRRWRPVAGIAVAAAAVAVVFFQPPAPMPATPERVALSPPLVEAAEDDVAVMETSNPDITVVWFY